MGVMSISFTFVAPFTGGWRNTPQDAELRCAPADVARVGSPLRLFYNKLWGPLRAGVSVTVKTGFNGWEKIVEQPMRRDPEPFT